MRRSFYAAAALVAALALSSGAEAQQDFSDVEIETVRVADGIYMLVGRGGNIGLSVGPDGPFLIDDQFAPLTDRITDAVAALSDRPIRFVLNTHWHGDHTGGNENLGEAGALIVAHENVRQRMSVDQFIEAFDSEVPASPPVALPVVTFTQDVTFHLNGDAIHAFHVPPAHTDGDAIVHFREANAFHMGDTYFANRYPFIDLSSGGSVHGVIGAVARVLAMADDETRIIPGHGPLSNRRELQRYHDMLATVVARIEALVEDGASLEEVRAAGVTRDFDTTFGDPERFVGIVFADLSRPAR